MTSLVPAAQYLRMSTDHQRYSLANQAEAIRRYADSHGMVIIKSYEDAGKSGLTIEGRDALLELIDDVQSGRVDYEAILVYDVSRWGRFQNVDESAYYEFLCTREGVRVIYCGEPFENDGTPIAAIYKSMKRAMAGEYSRELSVKVWAGQRRITELGYSVARNAGFGLRRILLDEHGLLKQELRYGQRKALQTDRVKLAPGPRREVQIVNRIYEDFVFRRLGVKTIADDLNSQRIFNEFGRPWTRGTIEHLLKSEKYTGTGVYNRTSFKLRQRRVVNSRDQQIRCENAFPAIVSRELFEQAQQVIRDRPRSISNERMLDLLRALRDRAGYLSVELIDRQPNMPTSASYRYRFGSLPNAYTLIGIVQTTDYSFIDVNRRLPAFRETVIGQVSEVLASAGCDVDRASRSGVLQISRECTLTVQVTRCRVLPSGGSRWQLRLEGIPPSDLLVLARLARDNRSVQDYFVVPRVETVAWPHWLLRENGPLVDGYRYDTLDVLGTLAGRSTREERP